MVFSECFFSFLLSFHLPACSWRIRLVRLPLRASAWECQLIGPGSQVYNLNFLKARCLLGLELIFMIYRQISDHQSWKSRKDSVDILHPLTSMSEGIAPREDEKCLGQTQSQDPPGLWGSVFNFLCCLSSSAFLPLQRQYRCCDQRPSNAGGVIEVCVFENVCVLVQKEKKRKEVLLKTNRNHSPAHRVRKEACYSMWESTFKALMLAISDLQASPGRKGWK